MNVGTLVRRNELHDNSSICIDTGTEADAMQDLIVEENEIYDNQNGIICNAGSRNLKNVIIKNHNESRSRES